MQPQLKKRHRSWMRQGRILPQSLWRECSPPNALISDFWPPELLDNKFLFQATQFVIICHGPYVSSYKNIVSNVIKEPAVNNNKLVQAWEDGIGLEEMPFLSKI